jgi:N-acyl-L-homoserine lactone synthetase
VTTQRLFEGFTFKVASAREQAQALSLRRELYLEEFREDGLDDLDAIAHHLVALNPEQRVVGALRLIDETHRPFDLEHHVDLPHLGPGRIPAEVGRFCVSKDYRRVRSGQFVHLGMFKLLYAFADQHRITDIFTLGLPELRSIYRFTFFRDTQVVCDHPIGNRLVQLMHLDLVDVKTRYADSRHPIARLLFQMEPSGIKP